MIPYSKLNWSKNDIKLWKKTIIAIIETSKKEKDFKTIITEYTKCITLFNFILANNKPKAIRKRNTSSKNITIECDNNNQPEQITRTVGMITVKSQKIPRKATEKTITKYKIANWRTRGYVRHLKSGKNILIKESIHHRKCLNKSDAVPQTTIIVK